MNRKIDITENHLSQTDSKWFAVYTGYKREKIVEKLLNRKGIQSFLPLQKITKQYVSKRKTVELPLFNCFIFVCINKSEYVSVLETEHVIRFVKIGKNLISIPEKEIDTIKFIIGEKVDLEAEVLNLTGGEEVEIIAGSLSGMKGKLVQQNSKYNFLVELKMIGYGLRITVKPENLRRIRMRVSQ